MVFVPKTHGEGKRPLPSSWFWCQKHTVKATGRCLHHGFGAKTHTVKASGRCLHHGFWCQKHTVTASGRCFTMVLVPKTHGLTMVLGPKAHGEGKRPLPSPWFWCQKHTVNARPALRYATPDNLGNLDTGSLPPWNMRARGDSSPPKSKYGDCSPTGRGSHTPPTWALAPCHPEHPEH